MDWSYTALSTYRKCRKRAFLQYVKKVIPYDQIDNRPFLVGIVLDWLFKKWITVEDYKEGWMENKAEEMVEWFATKRRVKFISPTDKTDLIHKAQFAAKKLEQVALDERFPEREFIAQLELQAKVGALTITGKLDFYFPVENAIYDLKITKTAKYLEAFQLHLFAWLVEKARNAPVEVLGWISPLMTPSVRLCDWSVLERQAIETTIAELNELIMGQHWEKTSKDCWGCPVYRFCEEPSDIKSRKRNPQGGLILEL